MLVSSYISPKASKGGPSAIEGRGLVAVAPIAKDELVAIKGGHIVDTATLRSLPERLAPRAAAQVRKLLLLVSAAADGLAPRRGSRPAPADGDDREVTS